MQRTASALTLFLLVLAIAFGCFLSLRSIRVFPNFSATDEAIIFDYADTLKRTGSIQPSLNPFSSPVINGNLYIYAAAAWTNLFPDDPFALRHLSALGGFALLAVVYAVTRQFGSPSTALTTTALMATNLLWAAVSHVGRQDVWLAVVVWAAVAISLVAQARNSPAFSLLSGLLVALSADVHPFGMLACVALGISWLLRRRSRAVSRRLLFAFVFGGLLGTAYYAAVHILPDPTAFIQALRSELVSNGAEGGSPLGAMLQRHLNYLASNPLEVGLLLFCALIAARQRQARGIGAFVLALVMLYALLVADPNPYYSIVWVTGWVILSSVVLSTLNPRARIPLVLAFFAAFVVTAARIERHVSANWNTQALAAIQQVAAQVPSSSPGLAETFLYVALRDQHLLRDSGFIGFTYVYFRALETGMSYWDVISTLNPAWLVTMTDNSAFTPPYDTLSVEVPHMRLVIPPATLEAQYVLTDSILTSVGTFEIWQRR